MTTPRKPPSPTTATIGTRAEDRTAAISTLVVAALFNPLRVRLQRAVDQRFNRARYDQEAALAAFATGLRDEVDVDRVLAGMRQVAEHAVQPTVAAVWRRDRGSAS